MNQILNDAFVRSIFNAIIIAGSTFFTMLSIVGFNNAAIAAGSGFFGTLVSRFGLEGYLDAHAGSRAVAYTPPTNFSIK